MFKHWRQKNLFSQRYHFKPQQKVINNDEEKIISIISVMLSKQSSHDINHHFQKTVLFFSVYTNDKL